MSVYNGYNWQGLYQGIKAIGDTQNKFLAAEDRDQARAMDQQNKDRQFGVTQAQLKIQQDQAARTAAMDPLQRQLMQAKIAQARQSAQGIRYMKSGSQIIAIGPDNKPQVVHEAPLTPEQQIYQQFLQSGGQPQQQPSGQPPQQQEPQPQFQPQSFEGGPIVSDPRFIEAQVGAPEQQQPGGLFEGITPEQRRSMMLNKIFPGSGNLEFKKQQASPLQLQPPAVNVAQKDVLDADAGLGRLRDIERNFKPEYLTMWDRVKYELEGAKQKWIPGYKMDPQTRQQYSEYIKFRRSAAENINRYIKEITGAQMSEAEAKRLMMAQPQAGQGLTDGDDPVRFQAKLSDAVASLSLARARRFYLLKQGQIGDKTDFRKSPPPINLDDMRQIMRQRRQELLQDASSRLPEGAERQQFVIQAMRQEFGV